MMQYKLSNVLLLLLLLITLSTTAQKITPAEYIQQYAATAYTEMLRSGVPATITLAQGILESESGNSPLALKSNNHFGIKCKTTWAGEKVYHTDDAVGECFRKYNTVQESYVDHSDFLKNNVRYAALFSLDKNDYKSWAHGLKKAGYATNPIYAQKLINLIEKYNLLAYNTTNDKTDTEAAAPPVKFENNLLIQPTEVVYDPKKILYINETKAIQVAAGSSWLQVATANNIALSRLLDFNDMPNNTPDYIANTTLIFLQRKRKQAPIATYTITSTAETPHTIAQQQGIRLDALCNYNKISATQSLTAGQVIYLQKK